MSVDTLTLKIRITVLWIFLAVSISAHSILWFMEPGAIQQIMTGVVEGMPIGPEMLLFMAIFWWVPLVMAFLSVTLKNSYNRWANLILGVVFTGLNIFHLIEHLMKPSAAQLLIIGSTVVAAILIVWYAWKLPK